MRLSSLIGPVIAALLAVAPAAASDSTTVQAGRPQDVEDSRVSLDDASLWAAPEDLLLAVPGTTLVHEGGPLAPVRPLVRGLGGARLGVDIGGLSLNDPATGLVDVAFLPWGAADSATLDHGGGDALAGTLHLSPRRRAGVRGALLVGDLGTARVGLGASDGDLALAVSASTTRGDFTFQPTSPVAPAADELVVRANNDHARASILGSARAHFGAARVDTVAFVGGHAGGIAGLATSPPLELRVEEGLIGARGGVTNPSPAGDVVASIETRAASRATWGRSEGADATRSSIASTGARAEGGLKNVALGDGRLDVVANATRVALTDGRFTRTGAGAEARLRLALGPVRARISLAGDALTDVGPLWGGELRVEAGDTLLTGLRMAHASRAPTLDELYAPRGLVLGNAGLRPEATDDVEAFLAFVPGRLVDVRAAVFAGVLEEGIAYVNKDAFHIAPVNLGGASRLGIDTSVTIKPTPFLALDVAAEGMASRLNTTGAPLPQAAPFSAWIAGRVGEERGPVFGADLRARGPSPSNIFGTVVAAPYMLVDVVGRLPVNDQLAVGASVTNLFDVHDARDSNQLPLPGRLLFVTLEVQP